MGSKGRLAEMARAALEPMVAQAHGDARKLAAVALFALNNDSPGRAYELAREARRLAPDDYELRSLTDRAFGAAVPDWHFAIVRDEGRNRAYEAALKRAAGPEALVLDIGAGTGLLAMMAARAGAGAVVTCEMNPAVADAAADIVAANGLSERVTVVPKRSTDLVVGVDMARRADILVSEIVSNDLLGEAALPVMEDAVARLLDRGGTMIPCAGEIRVALAHWDSLDDRRLGTVSGFDLTAFNRLHHRPQRLKVGDDRLSLRSRPVSMFHFDFASGGPFRDRRANVRVEVEDGPANGIVQWIRLQLDQDIAYENQPCPGRKSCWSPLFYPLERESDPGSAITIFGSHDRHSVRIWAEA
jgi:protein arginine N-methyltransferase 7